MARARSVCRQAEKRSGNCRPEGEERSTRVVSCVNACGKECRTGWTVRRCRVGWACRRAGAHLGDIRETAVLQQQSGNHLSHPASLPRFSYLGAEASRTSGPERVPAGDAGAWFRCGDRATDVASLQHSRSPVGSREGSFGVPADGVRRMPRCIAAHALQRVHDVSSDAGKIVRSGGSSVSDLRDLERSQCCR